MCVVKGWDSIQVYLIFGVKFGILQMNQNIHVRFGKRFCVTCPYLQKKLMSLRNIMLYFMIKFVIDDQVGSRIINVLQNILLINK